MDFPLEGQDRTSVSCVVLLFCVRKLSAEKLLPSGTSQSEVLSPCLLRQQANVRYCTYHFGQQNAFVERTYCRYNGGSKGVMPDPLSWRSRNQEVPCVLFVKLSSHKKVSAGAGCVSPHGSCRNQPANTISALKLWAKENRGGNSPVLSQIISAAQTTIARPASLRRGWFR